MNKNHIILNRETNYEIDLLTNSPGNESRTLVTRLVNLAIYV